MLDVTGVVTMGVDDFRITGVNQLNINDTVTLLQGGTLDAIAGVPATKTYQIGSVSYTFDLALADKKLTAKLTDRRSGGGGGGGTPVTPPAPPVIVPEIDLPGGGELGGGTIDEGTNIITVTHPEGVARVWLPEIEVLEEVTIDVPSGTRYVSDDGSITVTLPPETGGIVRMPGIGTIALPPGSVITWTATTSASSARGAFRANTAYPVGTVLVGRGNATVRLGQAPDRTVPSGTLLTIYSDGTIDGIPSDPVITDPTVTTPGFDVEGGGGGGCDAGFGLFALTILAGAAALRKRAA